MIDPTHEWEAFLSGRFGRPVEVSFSRARTAPVKAVDDGRVLRVKLHRFFAEASSEVRDDLAAWLRNGRRSRRASARLDEWIDARLSELQPVSPRRVALHPCGEAHDLTPLVESLFRDEFLLDFEERPRPGITWGRRQKSRARRSLQLGSYDPETNVVRVHPVLDRPKVPDWFVRYVLFHEILHAALPQLHHGPEFRCRERTYPDYARAVAWQRTRIDRLIRAARRADAPGGLRQRWLF